ISSGVMAGSVIANIKSESINSFSLRCGGGGIWVLGGMVEIIIVPAAHPNVVCRIDRSRTFDAFRMAIAKHETRVSRMAARGPLIGLTRVQVSVPRSVGAAVAKHDHVGGFGDAAL